MASNKDKALGQPSDKIFASSPAIFVFRTHFTDAQLDSFEDALESAGAKLTYDILEAKIFVSKVTKKVRLLFDLRAKGITLEEQSDGQPSIVRSERAVRRATRRSLPQTKSTVIEISDDASTASEGDDYASKRRRADNAISENQDLVRGKSEDASELQCEETVTIVRTEWVEQSIKAGYVLPFADFTILSGVRHIISEVNASSSPKVDQASEQPRSAHKSTPSKSPTVKSTEQDIIARAREDVGLSSAHPVRSLKRKFQGSSKPAPFQRGDPSWAPGHSTTRHAHLLHSTTSEEDSGFSSDLPEPPDWVSKGVKYACQRSTLSNSPNETWISLLRTIKLARILTSDDIGVRAYSTSIAALLAYPHKLVNPKEVLRLPGCDAKIANLFIEWANTGTIKAVEEIESDRDLKVLRLFYNIWGVGSLTAREFYFDRGWQDLDDLVEFNWKGLSRVQQIGVKYYDEFLDPIPRDEVERIGAIVHEHAVKVRDQEVQSMIVGGYRRGKAASGDVDMIVSHPDEEKTLGIITDIVASLEDAGWITHTLLLSTNNSKRDQQTLPFRSGDMHGGHGFDSLDKALVVWQDPEWPTKASDLATDPNAKNKNIHRRVDIIIAPWRTVGCAVLGWSGGTTFQRDVRRYVKHAFGWKFDSSGVRDRGNGEVLDLEGYHRYEGNIGKGRAKIMLQAEKRVFEGLKLEYREAIERCTD